MRKAMLAALLLLSLFSLSGCMQVITERTSSEAVPEVKAGTICPMGEEVTGRTRTVMLSFLSGDGGFVRVPRTVEAVSLSRQADAAVNALLEGPAAGERGRWPQVRGRTGAQVTVTGEIALCSLPSRYRSLEPEELYAVRTAVAATLCDMEGIRYAVVLVGGREEGIDLAATVPAGAFDGSAQPDLARAQRSATNLVSAALFLPSQDGRYLLGQVQALSLSSKEPAESMYRVLEALGSLGEDRIPAPLSYLAEMPEITKTEDGQYRLISLVFSASLDAALSARGLGRGIYAGMLCQSLLNFVPGVDGLSLTIGGRHVTGFSEQEMPGGDAVTFARGILTAMDFTPLLGTGIQGYLPENGKVTPVLLALPAEDTGSPARRLEALAQMDVAQGVLPAGISPVLGYRLESDKIAVNLDAEVLVHWKALPAGQGRLAVSCLVNTLTQDMAMDAVVLFFGGQQQDGADGISLAGALYRDAGQL